MPSLDLTPIITDAFEKGASDIFLKAEKSPAYRINGQVQPSNMPALNEEEMAAAARLLMNPEQQAYFNEHHEMDLGYDVGDICRVRANIYMQRGKHAFVFRIIPYVITPIEKLGLPRVLRDLAAQRQGLVLVTGPTGSGKSTTLAAMINLINRNRSCNIVTIEDPIEFVYKDEKAHVTQREVGIDTESFSAALKRVVRQSPDVILIGEMRDVETMMVALQASETGHLVFATLHTISASETLERIINLFPPHERHQVLLRLNSSLKGVVSQKLLPRADGSGRVAAVEVMIVTPTVAKLILEGKTSEVYPAIQGGEYYGMQTMNQALDRYVKTGLVSEEEALFASNAQSELRHMLRR
ncbi:MAG: type IV pilus twitching motility protein PilT [Armatimonadetes bacterium]|nr:type IV pilus twitching motility protein PilT [Armatimonadota bacterium]